MSDRYQISESYVNAESHNLVPQVVDDFARKWVGGHYMIALAIIVVLVLLVLWLLFKRNTEKFNPTATMRMQQLDGLGEGLDPGTDRSQSYFAQETQNPNSMGSFSIDPAAAANQPGSLGYQVLHSADFSCATRTPVGNDAWAWMTNVANSPENFTNNRKPKTDSDFSKVLAGHA
jgi:hypothetical protein